MPGSRGKGHARGIPGPCSHIDDPRILGLDYRAADWCKSSCAPADADSKDAPGRNSFGRSSAKHGTVLRSAAKVILINVFI